MVHSIRECLLKDKEQKRRIHRKPHIEQKQYATLLAALGQSRLSSNLNQLAKSVNMGTLDVSQDAERQLQEAHETILIMRDTLLMALGLKVSDDK